MLLNSKEVRVARRPGLMTALQKVAREQARHQRREEAERNRRQRDQVRRLRVQAERETAAAQSSDSSYQQSRHELANEMSADLVERVEDLKGILSAAHVADLSRFIPALKRDLIPEPFTTPTALEVTAQRPLLESYTKGIQPASGLEKMLHIKGRFAAEMEKAEQLFKADLEKYEEAEAKRRSEVEVLELRHRTSEEHRMEKLRRHNLDVDELQQAWAEGEPQAILTLFGMLLERSSYPEGFAQRFRMAYLPDARELVVDYELPLPQVVPHAAEYRYGRTLDLIEEVPREPSDIAGVYHAIVGATALRTLHEVLSSDQVPFVHSVVFQGFVNCTDPKTGLDARPYLVSVRARRESFPTLELATTGVRACLESLGARISPEPHQQLPVEPLVDFDSLDRQCLEGADAPHGFDARPNLMELPPHEFEELITGLFLKMGLEMERTSVAKDGSLEFVAQDRRPIIGGQVLVRVMRRDRPVDIVPVREFFELTSREGVNRGIMVSTSSFELEAGEFIHGKAVEFMDGRELLEKLDRNLGLKARISRPE